MTRDGRALRRGRRTRSSQFAVVLLSSPLRNDLDSVERRAQARARRRRARDRVRDRARLRRSRRSSRGASAGSTRAAARIAGRATSTCRSSTPPPTSSGSSRARSSACALRLASLDRARAEFIANASHELRTPLFSLAGFLELLASEELDAETRADFMAAIREPGRRA